MPDNKMEQINIPQTPDSNQESLDNKQESDVESEAKIEKVEEKVEEKKEDLPEIEKADPNKVAGLAAQSAPMAIYKKREQEIDKILSEGLNDIYLKMSPAKREEFKIKGEETTKKVNDLLGETKIQVKKIINLIKAWLKVIPGVNKFFLEQETKLKTDKLLDINKNL